MPMCSNRGVMQCIMSLITVLWSNLNMTPWHNNSVSTFRRPVALAYVVLSTLPCFAFLIASSEVKSWWTIHRKCCYPSWFWDSMHDVLKFSQMLISLLENQTDVFCINRDTLNSPSQKKWLKKFYMQFWPSLFRLSRACVWQNKQTWCAERRTQLDSKHLYVSLSFSLPFQVQIRNDLRMDTFAELPVSLVLLSLICIDIVERIRYCRLTGRGEEVWKSLVYTVKSVQIHSALVWPQETWNDVFMMPYWSFY